MASPSQSSHHVEDGDESSVSTTATDHDNKDTTTSVQSAPSLPPKSKKKKKNRSTKSSSSTIKSNDNSHLTTAEQELYNSHARQIRQNAMQLLNNAEASPSSNRYYRSYHNDHHGSAIQPSTVFPMNNSTNMTEAHHPRGVETLPSSSSGDLSVSQIASMAFGCIAHCLTESYRAASNYYSTTTQPPMSYNDYRYETVGISGGESGNGVAAVVTNSAANSHIGELSRGGSANAGNRHAVSYQDYNGYQQTMERDGGTAVATNTAIINKDNDDTSLNNNNNQSSGQKSTEQRGMGSNDNDGRVKVKGEYATVSLPSTYQGGK